MIQYARICIYFVLMTISDLSQLIPYAYRKSKTTATNAPITAAPITATPITAAPMTAAPVTIAPVTVAPVTVAPVTAAPTTTTSPTVCDDNFGTPCTTSAECTCSLVCCVNNIGDTDTFCNVACPIVSDKRLKTNIHCIGMSPSGIPVYTWKYREEVADLDQRVDTDGTYFGAMAQDLLELAPNAVTKNPSDGYYRVDYSKIDVDSYKLV